MLTRRQPGSGGLHEKRVCGLSSPSTPKRCEGLTEERRWMPRGGWMWASLKPCPDRADQESSLLKKRTGVRNLPGMFLEVLPQGLVQHVDLLVQILVMGP